MSIAEGIDCLVDLCSGNPTERLTVNHDGLLIDYAICRPHAVAVKNGALVAAPADPARGLVVLSGGGWLSG